MNFKVSVALTLLCFIHANCFESTSLLDSPCPDSGLLAPCVCSTNVDARTLLDCSDASTEDDLRNVFAQIGPNSFFELYVNQNGTDSNIIALSSGVFGQTSFEIIYFTSINSLQMLDSDIFDGMKTQLLNLTIMYADLKEFVMDFTSFSSLEGIWLYQNSISSFSLVAPTLKSVHLDANQLNQSTFFADAPNLEVLYLNLNNFTAIPDISQYSQLTIALFQNNNVTQLLTNDLCVPNSLWLVSVSSNELTTVQENSMCLFNESNVYLQNNRLTTLDENVYGPIVDSMATAGLRIYDNPLVCGCDIAWLLTNNRLEKLTDETSCADGRLLIDLDPADYADC